MIIRPIFTTYLAEDMPAGLQGQPAHKKGSALSFACQLNTAKLGNFVMTTPNPVFLFLDFAEKTILRMQDIFPEINSSTNSVIFANEPALRKLDEKLLYEYLECATIVPILLCSALEAFANQLISENFIYKGKSKLEIERYISFDDKYKKVLRKARGISIFNQPYWTDFSKTKELRDKLIHLKTAGKTYLKAYDDIFMELVDFDFSVQLKNSEDIIKLFVPDFFDK